MSFESGSPFFAPPFQSGHIPSSVPVSLFPLQQDYRQGPSLANLSPFPGWAYVPTPPFELQQLEIEMQPHHYQPHFPTVGYNPSPTQQFMNQSGATQQVPPAVAANVAFAPPYIHRVPEDTTTRGRVQRPTGKQRKSPYDRPPTPASSQPSSQLYVILTFEKISWSFSYSLPSSRSPASEFLFQRRLAVQGVCMINDCQQTFTSAKVYQDHVQISHEVKRGKHGGQILPCPWENCHQSRTEASLWNHLLGHNVKRACLMCHKEFQGDRSDSVKRHMKTCKEKSTDDRSEGYIYFAEES
jgi:hypothetical protein